MTMLDFDTVGYAKYGSASLVSYGGLHWNNMLVTDPFTQKGYTGSGFESGATSGGQVASNGYGNAASVSAGVGTFTLGSVEMSAGWYSSLNVDVSAYDAQGKMIHDQVVTVSDAGPQLEDFGWTGVNTVKFTPLTGTADSKLGAVIGKEIIFDDLQISDLNHTPLHAAAHSADML